jgi:hypothetical protein
MNPFFSIEINPRITNIYVLYIYVHESPLAIEIQPFTSGALLNTIFMGKGAKHPIMNK